MARHSRLNFIERAWANVWQTLVWMPRDWYRSNAWTVADSLLLIAVAGLLGVLIGVSYDRW